MTLQTCSGCQKPKPREWCWERRTDCPSGVGLMTVPDSITCPVCNMTSYNPTDIEMGYCGNCHGYTGVVDPLMKAKRFIEETQRVDNLDLREGDL